MEEGRIEHGKELGEEIKELSVENEKAERQKDKGERMRKWNCKRMEYCCMEALKHEGSQTPGG